MAIRPATKADMPALERLCDAFQAEHRAGADLPYDPPMFMQSLAVAIDSDDALLLMLDDDKGFLLGSLGATPYSPVTVANEMLWYTVPEARGKGFGLFRAYMRWAKEKQVKYVFMTMPEESEVLLRLGFKQADVGYYKRLE
jgi:GNAT superfamily N-acetyltransferase